MKKIIFGIVLTAISVVANAQTTAPKPSGFERGYQEGKASCEANSIKEAWVCKIKNYWEIPNCDTPDTSYGSGRTRAEASGKINMYCLADAAERGVKPTCTKF